MSRGKIVTATRKLWLSRDGQLVEHGSQRAGTLFCVPGQKLTISTVEQIENAHEFFPLLAEPEVPNEPEQVPQKRGPGRPRKSESESE